MISSFALNSDRLTISFLVMIVLGGIALFFQFPRSEDPPIVIREAVVTAFYPGLTPGEMEQLVTQRIEEQIRTMPEIDEISSDSKAGAVIIHATLEDEYENLPEIFTRLRSKMADLVPSLPQDTIGPFVNDEFGLTAVATVALWTDGFTMAEMHDAARNVRDRLYELEGIRRVDLYGIQGQVVYLRYTNSRLAELGITTRDLLTTLVDQNVILGAGRAEFADQAIVLHPTGRYQSVEDIAATLIRLPGLQNSIRLDDIVEIEEDYEETPSEYAYFNGKTAIVLSVSIVPGVNAVDFGDRLTAKIRDLETGLPVGFVMEFATYQPDLVEAAVNGALSSVYQTLGIVAVVVILFLGVRTGLIVGAFVPVTMLFGLIVMSLVGVELERVSIISAIVALGMLVDNAIVVAENIRSRMERGEEKKAAAVKAGRTLAVPLLTSSLTTILAFMPMLLLDGQTGEYAYSLPVVVMILLLGSWFLSMYVTPAMCVWFMTAPATGKDGAGKVQEANILRAYRSVLVGALKARWLVVLITLAGLVGAGIVASSLVREFFGPSDRNQFLAYVELPAGSRIHATDAVTRRVSAWLQDREVNPEVTSHIAYVGTGGPRFFLSLSPLDPDPHVAFLVINTETGDQVPAVIDRMRDFFADEVPEASSRLKRMWMGANEPGLTEIRIVGLDADNLFDAGERLVDAIAAMPGVDYVRHDWENRLPRLEVRIDQARARRAGVTTRDVALSLETFADGQVITDYRQRDEVIPITLQTVQAERDVLGDLWNTSVSARNGSTLVPLTQVADIMGVWDFNRIVREDQERTVTVETNHQYLKAPEMLEAIRPALAEIDFDETMRWEIGGEIETSAESNEKLMRYLPHCFVGIVLLLIWQFNSFRRPSIIMLTIPMAFGGAFVGLQVLGAPFDFFSLLGLLSLAGVIINNGIVLIDSIENLNADPATSRAEALVEGTVSRFRPILMSAITTMLGVMPIILVRDPLFYSMATVIAFGLAFGTVLSLLVVPVIYAIFFGVRVGGR
jgi:multidrug efflux pump subunit AcrB